MKIVCGAILAVLLSGCAVGSGCPMVKNWSLAEELKMDVEVKNMPETAITPSVYEDYGRMRLQSRACSKN